MTLYILTDWEQNGHDDSDFWCSYYDDVNNRLSSHMYGTTRAVAPTNVAVFSDGSTSVAVDGQTLILPNSFEIVEKARLCLADYLFAQSKLREETKVMRPDVSDLYPGLLMMVKA